jgi:hypothetical protein
MGTEINFARFNIHLKSSPELEASVSKLQELLYEAALNAHAEDPEVFFESEKSIVGVSVELEHDTMLILEAGAILGQCQMAYEQADFAIDAHANWFSIVDADGNVIQSPW